MKHFSHLHELHAESVQISAVTHEKACFGCELPLFGACYACSDCKFYLHKFCYDLPQSLQFETHPDHALGLLYPSHCQEQCDACGGSCNGFAYNCKPCNFNVHAICAAMIDTEPKADPDHCLNFFSWYKLSELKTVRSQLMSKISTKQNNDHQAEMQRLKRISDSMDIMGTIGASSKYTYRYI